jgi:tRNA synthetases class I (E and Q), anti-codon binding domain.
VNEYVYVDREDINTGDVVRLKDLCNIRIESESNGVFIASVIETEKMPEKKIQWVPKEEVVKVRVEKPLDLLDGDIPRKDSLQIDTGLAEKSVSSLKNGEIVQFVRYGFVKKDRMEDIPVFIYTC